jgi:serine protease Do
LDVRELNEELATRYGLKPNERGVVIVRVKPGSTADDMGVREGDIVLEVNRKPISSIKSYDRAVSGLSKDQAVLLLLKRKGQTIYLTLRP